MVPQINRFLGALQGIPAEAGWGEGGEVVEIAESLLANGGFVGEEIGAIISMNAGAHSSSAPLWRAVPLALLHFDNPAQLESDAEKACRLTHPEPSDIAASVGMALALGSLLRSNEAVVPHVFLKGLATDVEKYDQHAPMRILTVNQSLKAETPFVGGRLAHPLQIFRAALFLFLACPACDLETDSARLGIRNAAALNLAYSLAGSSGLLCRMEKPTLRLVMIAEAFQRVAEERAGNLS